MTINCSQHVLLNNSSNKLQVNYLSAIIMPATNKHEVLGFQNDLVLLLCSYCDRDLSFCRSFVARRNTLVLVVNFFCPIILGGGEYL